MSNASLLYKIYKASMSLILVLLLLASMPVSVSALTHTENEDFWLVETAETTDREKELVKQYLEKWNEIYITNNPVISSADKTDREYYIVKTIYNFLAKNTIYDDDVYNGKYTENDLRYRYAHTAYGALFGNVSGSYNPDTFDIDAPSLDYMTDSQGLYRVATRNQGMSVCDGYALVFFYLCRLNGIDCKVVEGDYTDTEKSDPHAWNLVKLKDYDDEDYIWYNVDATFGCHTSQKISDDFTIVNYDYFLRGTDSKSFSSDKHQTIYDDYSSISQSRTDYKFGLKHIDTEALYGFVSRRRVEDKDKIILDTGVYNLESYLIISPDGTYHKIHRDDEGNYSLIDAEGFDYSSTEYYYSFDLLDFAHGVEYSQTDRQLKDAGTFSFSIDSVLDGSSLYSKDIVIAPLFMGELNNNYNLDLTKYSDKAYFNGADIQLDVKIYDNKDTFLQKGFDYNLYCFKKGDEGGENIVPNLPGEYTVRVQYCNNYEGCIDMLFTVYKADLSRLNMKKAEFKAGTDIAKAYASLSLGSANLTSGVDYKIDVLGSNTYGSVGKVKLTALDGSKYLEGGTVAYCEYEITKQQEISSVIVNIPELKYNGKEQSPQPVVMLGGVTLQNGKDYTVTGNGKEPGVYVCKITGNGIYKELYQSYLYYINPASLSSVKVKQGSTIDISWAKQGGNCLYQLYAYDSAKSTWRYIAQTSADKINFNWLYVNGSKTSVKPNSSYKIRLRAAFSANVSGEAVQRLGPLTELTVRTAPAAPSIKATSYATSIKLSWQAQSGCSYQVYAYDSVKKLWKYIASTNSNSYKLTYVYTNGKKINVSANKAYNVRVRAYFTAKVNGKSENIYGAFTSITPRSLPKTPTIKLAKNTKSKYIKASWSKDTAVNGYQVQLATNSSFTSGLKKASITKNATTSYTFKNLKKGKTYYVRVRSYKKVGNTVYYSAYKTGKIKL